LTKMQKYSLRLHSPATRTDLQFLDIQLSKNGDTTSERETHFPKRPQDGSIGDP